MSYFCNAGIILYLKDRSIHLILGCQLPLECFGVDHHSAEFEQIKGNSMAANALLLENRTAVGIVHHNDHRDQQHERQQHQQRRAARNQVKDPLALPITGHGPLQQLLEPLIGLLICLAHINIHSTPPRPLSMRSQVRRQIKPAYLQP